MITAVITPTWFRNAYAAYAVVAAPRVADVQAAASVHGISGTQTVPKVHQRAREALRGEPAFGADVLAWPGTVIVRYGTPIARAVSRELIAVARMIRPPRGPWRAGGA
ncbi:hypothetical protein BIU87_07255 [Streptomyces sp. ZS0098]|nr:hypothetical protein BIU87_07255 [Streptomyces sp. ZS0098]